MHPSFSLGLAGCLLALLPAQDPPGTVPTGQAQATTYFPTPIYRASDVSQTLKLTPEQVTRLNTVTEAIQKQYSDQYNKLGGLPEADRYNRLRELNQQYYAAWNKGAQDVFDATQRTRYQQIAYQYGGFGTLYDPTVQARLRLTPEQIKALPDHWTWSYRQMQDANRIGGTDATKGGQMYRDYWTAYQDRMNKFLTADQQKAWRELTGEVYTFQPPFAAKRP